jgi:hypothetical protein
MRLIIGLVAIAVVGIAALVLYNLLTDRARLADVMTDVGDGLADGLERAFDEAAVVGS